MSDEHHILPPQNLPIEPEPTATTPDEAEAFVEDIFKQSTQPTVAPAVSVPPTQTATVHRPITRPIPERRASEAREMVRSMTEKRTDSKVVFKKPNTGKIIIILAVLGLAVYGVRYYFDVLRRDPHVVFLEALTNTNQLRSVSAEHKVSMTLTPGENGSVVMPFEEPISIGIDATTAHMTYGEQILSSGKLVFDIPFAQLMALNDTASAKPKPEVHYVVVPNQATYVKIVNPPIVPLFDVSSLNDTWIQLSDQEVQQQVSSITGIGKSEQDARRLQQELIAVYRQYPFWTFTILPDETIGQTETKHYLASLDKSQAKNFLVAANDIMERYGYPRVFSPENVAAELQKIDVAADLWVTKGTPVFKKIHVVVKLTDGQSNVALDLTTTFDNMNRELVIIEPSQTITVQEAMDKIAAAQQVQANTTTTTDGLRGTINSLQTMLQLYYYDTSSYPLPPIGGNQLGNHALCLTSKGFRSDRGECSGIVYGGIIPRHPENPVNDFVYYLCSNSRYIIAFSLDKATDGLTPGNYFVMPDTGITQPTEISSGCLDQDYDGLPNFQESRYGTKPNVADSDGDTFLDGAEVINGYNPNGSGVLR